MMDLLEKVTKGLEVCREMNNPPGWRCTDCVECPYHENGCAKKLKEDALELLKELQPVHCKDCEIRDKGMACVCSTGDDWFCADAKQKDKS